MANHKSWQEIKRKRQKQMEKPEYTQNPRGLSVTVYDIQGDPISPAIAKSIEAQVESIVKGSGVGSLAIAVNFG